MSSNGEQGAGEKFQEQPVRHRLRSHGDVVLAETREQCLFRLQQNQTCLSSTRPSMFMDLHVPKPRFNSQVSKEQKRKQSPETSDSFKPKAALSFYVCYFPLWGCGVVILRNYRFTLIVQYSAVPLNLTSSLHKGARPVSPERSVSLSRQKGKSCRSNTWLCLAPYHTAESSENKAMTEPQRFVQQNKLFPLKIAPAPKEPDHGLRELLSPSKAQCSSSDFESSAL